MNFFIEAAIGCTITLIGYWFLSDVIFQKKSKKDWIGYLIIIIYAILITSINMVGNNNVDKVIKVILVFILMVLFNRYKYKEKLSDIILRTLIVYLNFYLAEVCLAIFLSIGFELLGVNLFGILKYSLLMNALTTTVSALIMKLLKKLYIKLLRNILYYDLNLIVAILIILIIVTILVTNTPVEEWNLNFSFISTMLLIIMFCFLGIYMIKQKAETDKITDKYTKLAQYSQDNEGLLEEYRVNLHESKNQLILINNMIPKKYKEIHEYIDGLIEKNQSGKYYWLTELKYVPLPELKGFMNFKIMEMINQGLDVEINVSREINKRIAKNYKPRDKEDLYSIIGVFLDNAKEAAKESKEKSVSVQMFMDKKDLTLIIANTYKGKVNLDRIDEYGYSTKGTNRGTGLHIVSGIIERNPLFDKETSILDNYFVQTLTIHSKKEKKK